jgi:hypothetical protein
METDIGRALVVVVVIVLVVLVLVSHGRSKMSTRRVVDVVPQQNDCHCYPIRGFVRLQFSIRDASSKSHPSQRQQNKD